MEQLSFRPVTPPEAVLARYELCRTHDLEEARQWGEKIFCENRLCAVDSKGAVNTRIYYRRIGSIGIGRMSYGGAVTIRPDVMENFALVQMPIRGEERIEVGSQRVVCNPHMGSVLNSHTPTLINHASNTEKLIIRIDRSLLERHCQQLLGRTLRNQIEFDSSMPLNTVAGARWLRMVGWVYDCVSQDDEIPPLMVAQLESGLVSLLLANSRIPIRPNWRQRGRRWRRPSSSGSSATSRNRPTSRSPSSTWPSMPASAAARCSPGSAATAILRPCST